MLDQMSVGWLDDCGFVTDDIMKHRFEEPSLTSEIFACGPRQLVVDSRGSAIEHAGDVTNPSGDALCLQYQSLKQIEIAT